VGNQLRVRGSQSSKESQEKILMKRQMTIGKKLMLAFGAMLALALGLAYAALSSVGKVGNALDTEINKTAKKVDLANSIITYAYRMRSAQRGVVMYSQLKDPAKVDQNKEAFQSASDSLQKAIAEIRPLLVNQAAREAVDTMQANFTAWLPLYEELLKFCANQRFDTDFTRTLFTIGELNNDIEASAAEIIKAQRETQLEEEQSAAATVSSSRWIALVLISLTVAVGGLVLLIVRTTSATLRRLADELGEGAAQTASAASQVSSSSQALAQGSSEQAASLQETSASSEEINSMARKNSENSHGAADLVTQSQQKFIETNQSLEQMVAAMGEIKSSSDKISKIIKTIDEIAFQTNILALNAAVEAARAGEAGMGFAVVADEVRNLAQRCAQAAKDTTALIEESIANANDGKTKVDQVAVAIRAITEESGKVKMLVEEVNLGSQEQVRGMDQIGKAISQMSEVTQTTAANAEESASAAEELNAQSESLKHIVARLNAMVGGSETGSSLPAIAGKRTAAVRHAASASSRHQDSTLDTREPRNGHRELAQADKNAFPMEEDFKKF
jgi:methyl-accepting chemotaxis protein